MSSDIFVTALIFISEITCIVMINYSVTLLLFHVSTGSTLHYNYYCRCCLFFYWNILSPRRDCQEFEWMKFLWRKLWKMRYVCYYIYSLFIYSIYFVCSSQFWVIFCVPGFFILLLLFVVIPVPSYLIIKKFCSGLKYWQW